MKKLKDIVNKRLSKISEKNTLPARLGRADGAVAVSNKPHMVYVTYMDGSTVEALNIRVPNTWGAMVIVGYDPVHYPLRRQVLSMWDVYQDVPWAGTPDHSASQQWPAPDTLYVRGEQALWALVTPVADSLSVQVWPTNFLGASAWKRFTAIQTVSVSTSVPATGARVSLLVVDSTGAFVLRDGSTVATRADITDADIPMPTAGDSPIAGLILVAGMTELIKNEFLTDIIDLRFIRPYLAGTVATAVLETSGPTTLDINAINDGEWLKRSGSNIVSGVPTGAGVLADYVLVRDEKTSGTNGGTFTSGAWQTRDINSIVSDSGAHCSLPGSNVIRLDPGTYQYKITCPAFGVNAHQARLYDVTAGAIVAGGEGTSMYNVTSVGITANSIITGIFTVSATNDFRIEHRCGSTNPTYGFGAASGFGKEVYTVAEFWKVA